MLVERLRRSDWLRLATARRVLGEADLSAEAYAKADVLAPLEPRPLADWAETEVRQLKPGQPPERAIAARRLLNKKLVVSTKCFSCWSVGRSLRIANSSAMHRVVFFSVLKFFFYPFGD